MINKNLKPLYNLSLEQILMRSTFYCLKLNNEVLEQALGIP